MSSTSIDCEVEAVDLDSKTIFDLDWSTRNSMCFRPGFPRFEDLKMFDKAAQRLQKMNKASKRGIIIRSSHMSLQDMTLERSDEYPSMSHLDSFDCSNKFHEIDKIRDYNKMYRIKSPYRLVPAGPGDRSCHWRPDALCIYKDDIVAGLRFPFCPTPDASIFRRTKSPCRKNLYLTLRL
ncbi:hypothetical protein POM88_005195 [Heracleum sosnowskyi]|uniref:Uncharacterized protein n=1 Tax=Heracleum sosnowskyi TaxID=360622 RepID=A0AAD8JJG3_9APIA|nr:hypothetical protein POM88_005195 [Heracleum sosnowskyi]